MHSRWSHLKEEAVRLRKSGHSLHEIRDRLGIAKSTLSGWMRDVKVSQVSRVRIESKRKYNLEKARKKASARHQELKEIRIATIRRQVEIDYPTDGLLDSPTLEIALAMLYLGEGSKTKSGFGLGNSDPMIIRFYVAAIQKLYAIDINSLRIELHLRADQDEIEARKFWSTAIDIPPERIVYVLKDKRTTGKPTYPGYKGVCYVGGGSIEFQRRLVYLSKILCGKV